MQRVTISLDETLAEAFDSLSLARGYQSRSEAVRDLVRTSVEDSRLDAAEAGYCVACLSYVYDHQVRELAQRLISIQHDNHDLVIAATHVQLDHDTCLQSVLLKGPTAEIRALADGIRAQRGVKFGAVNLISVAPNDHHDGHGHEYEHAGHIHLSPHRG